MNEIIITGLPEGLARRLEERANRLGRTVEEEARCLLEASLHRLDGDAASIAAAMRSKLAGRNHTDSALLLAKDRGR